MKSPISSTVFLVLALGGVAAADVPKKAPFNRYTSLYTNSPFTSKPPPVEAGPENNPLDDYALIGVSSIGLKGNDSIYRVTLINKKKPEERITVDSDNPKSDFKILGVTRKAGDPLGTVVAMSSGSMKGTVSFDEKLLTLAQPKPAAPPQAQPGQPGQPPQLQPDGQPAAQRQPRPRVMPPPTPQAGGQPVQKGNQPNNQQINGQQRNFQQRNNQPRPSRRGN